MQKEHGEIFEDNDKLTDNATKRFGKLALIKAITIQRRPGPVLAVSNPGSVTAKPFIICIFIASIIQNVK